MSEFYDFISDGLADSIEVMGSSFTWEGQDYVCVIDHAQHLVTVAKSLFPNADYPKCGDPIVIGGQTFQIVARGNAALRATESGLVEDPPFVDDPADPTLDLTFDHFTK